ncbi:hypothetical_protein [Candidozyma auris]|uniref:hypothetical_protein n=1 Tax=Candidozyma auris TaxID=498019 RepID=UPI000D2C666D|nr:hypothetical_protein [[Candida] auris]QEO20477.1 hypothetical_protein [[Candida] auris]GBL49550.1 hypothetical protein CAJCM15448_18240 [[Candida] auris]
MVDPDTFMKNSPFYSAHGDQYNLRNTTPDLLKFQLHEQNRAASPPVPVQSSFSCYLKETLSSNSISCDDSDDSDNDRTSHEIGGSAVSTPTTEPDSKDLHSVPASSKDFLNLRVLIENSVFDTSKISPKAIMSLSRTKQVKEMITDKEELKDYLQDKIAISNQFCSTLLFDNESKPDVDLDLVLKIMKQNAELQSSLKAVTTELDELRSKLNNHNLACLVLGYVEDIKHSASSQFLQQDLLGSPSRSGNVPDSEKSFDTLFSHIASLAVQNNVQLPEHPEGSHVALDKKVEWAQACIDAVVGAQPKSTYSTPQTSAGNDRSIDTSVVNEGDSVLQDHSFLSASPYKNLKESAAESKTIAEYRLALNDLRFSHQYFMKEYEYLKANSLKTISEYRKKNAALEKEISRLRSGSSVSVNTMDSDSSSAKDKEISRLRKELNSLKIETMGNKSPRNSGTMTSSLITNATADENTESTEATSPSYSSFSSMGAGSSMSNAILRKEFKKIVADLQDQYEVELGKERLKRKQLEEKLNEKTASSPES